MSTLPVLLVEDDPNDVLFLRRAVAKHGLRWSIDVATNGEDAIRKLQDGAIWSHVILDLKIPRKSGLEVLSTLRAGGKRSTRVVVLTSSREKKDLEAAARLGIDLYLVKPVAFQELCQVVEEIARVWSDAAITPARPDVPGSLG
jgi:CheY-like chemotaxis protein